MDHPEQHLVGHAHCRACGHRWTAVVLDVVEVAPDYRCAVVDSLECPVCRTDTGSLHPTPAGKVILMLQPQS